MDEQARQASEEAAAFAEESPQPAAQSLYEDVLA